MTADLTRRPSRHDARPSGFPLVGTYGCTLEVPGVPTSENARISENGILGIPGTPEALGPPEH